MVLLLLVALLFFIYSFNEKENYTLNISTLNKKNEPLPSRFDYNLVGKGALELSSEIQSFPFPDLSGEILFLAKNTRPDGNLYEVKLQIGLKGSDKSLRITPGQTLYLAYDQEHLNFSKEITPLWIKPKIDENGDDWLEMGIELINEEGEKLLNEMREFKVKQKWETKRVEEVTDPLLKLGSEALKNGKWWGPDKLYERYGGDEYQAYKGRERLEIQTGKESKILFINEGDTFIWKDGEWTPSLKTKGYPMGKVLAISPYKVELMLWDKEGMESVLLTFSKERISLISLRAEDIFTRLRRRTSSRVSCRIDNRATILKEGDWLVHTTTGWHTIKNYYEVEALLKLDIMGDLFVFDGLEKSDGKEVFCGTLFNPMRTEQHFVRLPMTQIKGGEHSPPTKNTFSTKIGPLPSEDNSTGPMRNNPSQKLEPIEDYEIFSED